MFFFSTLPGEMIQKCKEIAGRFREIQKFDDIIITIQTPSLEKDWWSKSHSHNRIIVSIPFLDTQKIMR